jgi:hypothetical protein
MCSNNEFEKPPRFSGPATSNNKQLENLIDRLLGDYEKKQESFSHIPAIKE